MRILIARTDRIGDVVLATPVFSLLKKINKNFYIAALIRDYTKPLLENNPYLDEIISFDKDWHTLLKQLRKYQFDLFIVLYPHLAVGLLGLLSGIKQRISTEAKLYNILFYNKIITQRRSKNLKSEAYYNIELVYSLFKDNPDTFINNINNEYLLPKLWLTPQEIDKGEQILKRTGLSKDKYKGIVGIHPGSLNSCKAFSYENYALLIDRLISRGFGVFVGGSTISQKEEEGIKKLTELIKRKFIIYKDLPLRDYMSVIYNCHVFVSNSTGPLHIAASLGKKTVGIFPPAETLIIRWAPPHKNCYIIKPDNLNCRSCSPNCKIDCMDTLDIEKVLQKIEGII